MALGSSFDSVLLAAQAGSGWAFERLWRETAPLVHAYARLQGCTEPEDLTSEVFLAAFRGLDRFSGSESQLRSWLLTIAHRRVIDERRRLARRGPAVSFDSTRHELPGGHVEADAMASLGSERAIEALDRLAPDQRAVLLLRILADLSIEQTAEVLGKRPGAVKALQRRGLIALRKHIETFGWEGVSL
ncbi:MAG TPA: sigma-70 family RNA polymerase sigma factor [Egibacteraceae bacterium]|nr:sigma-70 family RNA polymerase sigma factor [Egibacteraceae bacterium]